MLWLISSIEVQILLALWILLMLYAAWVTVHTSIRAAFKTAVIPFIFLVAYTSIITTQSLLGTPSFTDEEVQGKLAGYSVFEFNGKKKIAILISMKGGPFTFAIPYSPSDEKNLSQAMQKMMKNGIPTMIRKAEGKVSEMGEGEGEGSQGNSEGGIAGKGKRGRDDGTEGSTLEFYDFTDQVLVPKEPNSQ